ncbi:hypothetical protein LFM09_33905 [Lentzea alba]|uniref:hypothetical protein n=1 Tax=Lentzea alba TaxID=2714351 RepID=UPI0039BFB925
MTTRRALEVEAAGGSAEVEAVKLENAPEVVRAEVLRLAGLLGTTPLPEPRVGFAQVDARRSTFG